MCNFIFNVFIEIINAANDGANSEGEQKAFGKCLTVLVHVASTDW